MTGSEKETKTEQIAEKFNFEFHAIIGERAEYPDLSDEQYALMDEFQELLLNSYHDCQINGVMMTAEEIALLYREQRKKQIQALPEYARIGLLGTALQGVTGGYDDEYDPAHDKAYLCDFFAVEEETLKEVTGYFVSNGLVPYGPWNLVAWGQKAFPDLSLDEAATERFQQPDMTKEVHRRLSSMIDRRQQEFVAALARVHNIDSHLICHVAWENFVQQDGFAWLKIQNTFQNSDDLKVEDIIASKYLVFFDGNRQLLVEFAQATISEFEELLTSDKAVEADKEEYAQAIKVLGYIASNAL